MQWPANPPEFLALDLEQQADLLLAGLADCNEGERGRNFINNRLHEWFYDLTSGMGNPRDFDRMKQQRREGKAALDEAYALLEPRALIRPDPDSGKTFCEVTRAGRAQVERSQLPDAARVTFALRALDGISLHPALCNRQVDAHFLQGKFETALRDGAVFVEDAIRKLSGEDPKLVGVNLASKAFAPDTGKLADKSTPAGERAGLQQLYMGFFGAIRNQVGHKDFKYASDKEAFQALTLLDYLTGKLDAAAQRLGSQLS